MTRNSSGLLVAIVAGLLIGCTTAPNRLEPPAAAQSAAPPANAPAPVSASASTTVPPPAPVSIRFGLNTTTAQVAPVRVAKEEGFFTRYGIDAELVQIPGGERVVAALISGDIPLTTLAPTAAVTAGLAGADIAFYASHSNVLSFELYARPEFLTVRDLRGQKLATTGRGGIIQRTTANILKMHGLDAEQDATLVALGTINESLTALLNDVVAAAVLGPPGNFVAEDAGMRRLVDTTEARLPYLGGIAASREWVARNEGLTLQALQAFGEGLAFVHREPERTKAVIGKWAQTDDTRLLERTYAFMQRAWERGIPYVPAEALREELDALAPDIPAARDARAEQFIDNRLIETLDRSGFFQGLQP
jgi:NitT/TauT family transport system substrate-binding protein